MLPRVFQPYCSAYDQHSAAWLCPYLPPFQATDLFGISTNVQHKVKACTIWYDDRRCLTPVTQTHQGPHCFVAIGSKLSPSSFSSWSTDDLTNSSFGFLAPRSLRTSHSGPVRLPWPKKKQRCIQICYRSATRAAGFEACSVT